jgi:hypothetical protein
MLPTTFFGANIRAGQGAGGPPPEPEPDLLDEGFEGLGTPSVGWTETGTVDWDYATSPLEGAQSLNIRRDLNGAYGVYYSGFSVNEAWGHFLVRVKSMPGTYDYLFDSLDNNFNYPLRIRINASGTLTINGFGYSNQTTVDAMSTDTTYHVWWHYKKGTGSNSIVSAAFSTTSTRPSSGNKFVGITNGTNTATLDYVAPGGIDPGSGTGINGVWDKFQVASTDVWL